MARMPYTNFHDINLDWIIKRVMKAFTPDNPPDSDDIIDTDSGLNLTVELRKKQNRPESEGTAGQVLGLDNDLQPVWITPAGGDVTDVKINQSSIVNQDTGVAVIPIASSSDLGVIKTLAGRGIRVDPSTGVIFIYRASDADIKSGSSSYLPLTPSNQENAVFYGLASAAGFANASSLTMGTYTEQAKEKIQSLLGISTPQAGDYAPIITDSASGPVASFPDGANDLDMLSLVAEIVPVQAGTGNPSPNNIRPISGRGGITVYQTNFNTFPFAIAESKTDHDITVVSDGKGTYSISGTATNGSANITFYLTDECLIKSGAYLHMLNSTGNGAVTITLQDDQGALITAPDLNPANRIFDLSPFANASVASIRFYIASGTTVNMTLSPMVAYSSSVTPFTKYFAKEPILEAWGDIAGNIYGGTLDVLSGVLTVDWNLATFDGTESYQDSTNVVVCRKTFQKGYAQNANYIISSAEVYPNIRFTNNTNRNTFQFSKTAFGVADDVELKALFAQLYANNTPVTIAYKLETPINTYQLTPQQVQTILGQNNIYSDSGDCSVTYRADTKLFILKVIA